MVAKLALFRRIAYIARRLGLADPSRTSFARKLPGDERGQAMTEYILVAMLVMIPLIVLFVPMMTAIRFYLRGIYAFVGLPFF